MTGDVYKRQLVFHKDEEIYFGAYGYADKEEGRPMQRDTICRLYSLTKPVTAAAIMILAERGDLDLRDPVSLYPVSYTHLGLRRQLFLDLPAT